MKLDPGLWFMGRVHEWMREGPPWYGPDHIAFEELRDFALASMEMLELPSTATPEERFKVRDKASKQLERYRACALAAKIARGKRRS